MVSVYFYYLDLDLDLSDALFMKISQVNYNMVLKCLFYTNPSRVHCVL